MLTAVPLGQNSNPGEGMDVCKRVVYTRAFGNRPRHFEPWSSDEEDTKAGTPLPNYHTKGRMFQLSTDLMCIASLQGAGLQWF
ncbi:hypothetical protein TNCV_831271 [Trichonephila clavipes]|nr:hypothetical protein TNCV_831271 [Trichonephila clavipes]